MVDMYSRICSSYPAKQRLSLPVVPQVGDLTHTEASFYHHTIKVSKSKWSSQFAYLYVFITVLLPALRKHVTSALVPFPVLG